MFLTLTFHEYTTRIPEPSASDGLLFIVAIFTNPYIPVSAKLLKSPDVLVPLPQKIVPKTPPRIMRIIHGVRGNIHKGKVNYPTFYVVWTAIFTKPAHSVDDFLL